MTTNDNKTLVFETPKSARVTRAVTHPGTAYVAWLTEVMEPAKGAYPWTWEAFHGLEYLGSGEAKTEAHAKELAQRAVTLDLEIRELRFKDSQKPLDVAEGGRTR